MRPEKSSITELAIPSRGFSTRYPLAKMPPEFCAWLCDYEIGAGYLESRKGIQPKILADTNFSVGHCSHPTNPDLVIDVDTYATGVVGYYNPKTAARGTYGGWTSAGGVSYKARTAAINKKVFFFFEGQQPAIFDGTNAANTGLTGPTLANVVFGVTFKGHLWVFEHKSQVGWYHPTINGVAGALTSQDFSPYTQENGIIMCAFGFTLSSGLQSQNLFAVVFDSGEVLVYSGDYPAGTWAQIGSGQIGAPLGYQSIIKANGDVYVLTRNGVTSMRSLFTLGSDGLEQATISTEIEKFWQQAVRDIDATDTATGYDPRMAIISNICGSYHQTKNELVIFFPRFLKPNALTDSEISFALDSEQTSMALCFDLSAKAWRCIKIPDIEALGRAIIISSSYLPRFDLLLFSTNSTMCERAYSLAGSNYYDDDGTGIKTGISPELRTSFVKARQNFNCGGVLLTHSGQAATKSAVDINLVTEFGKTASSACSVATAAGVSEEFYNVGCESKSFQVVVSFTSPTDDSMTQPHQIVDVSLMLEPGGTLG